MLIHRYLNAPEPYELRFEIDPLNGYREGAVAAKALAITPFDQDRLRLTDDEYLNWSLLSTRALHASSSETALCNLTIHTLKTIGSALHYFYEITPEEIARLSKNNTPDNIPLAMRAVEGNMAALMLGQMRKRISVPILWQSHYSFGFKQWY